MSGAVLLYIPDEFARETVKECLSFHLPLIVTETRAQCLEAVVQKAPVHKALISVLSAEGTIELDIFEEISRLRPGLKMIAVGESDAEDAAVEAVNRGAAGYMVLPARSGELLAALR